MVVLSYAECSRVFFHTCKKIKIMKISRAQSVAALTVRSYELAA